MKNIEFYADKMKASARNAMGSMMLCDLVIEIPELRGTCDVMKCQECMCRIIDKLLAEHTEPPKISPLEREILKQVELDDGYVARDMDGKLYWFEGVPQRRKDKWLPMNPFKDLGRIDTLGAKLEFIKWEDEPRLVLDLLELEVEEDVE